MRRYLSVALTLLVFSAPISVFAEPGPEIPKLKHSFEEALKLARARFVEKDAAKEPPGRRADWIVIRAVLLPQKKRTEPRFWMIVFTHRSDNDLQCVIHIYPDGKVTSTGIPTD